MYNRTGAVYAAELDEPAVVRTTNGVVEAEAGDYVVVEAGGTQVRHYPPGEFAHCFKPVDRPVPLRALPALSSVAANRVTKSDDDTASELCARCETRRTRRTFEGLPTCTVCELSLRASREETMRCQHDGAEMRKEVIEDVIVDRCPECGGVWFDGGELEVLSNALKLAADRGMPSRLASRLFQSLVGRVVE
jgi:hypothetical protein